MATNIKENCKYWDKCYQKNSAHRNKYNHPSNEDEAKLITSKDDFSNIGEQHLTKKSPENKNEEADSCESTDDTAEQANGTSVDHVNDPNCASSSKDNEKEENNQFKEMDITKEYEEVMNNLSGKNYFEIFQKRVRYSTRAEYLDLLKTNDFIRHKFLVEMPDDFYSFWNFVMQVAKPDERPEDVFLKVGLKLVGPFEFLAGKFHKANIKEPGDYLRHWRFYYDPPEFQTVFVKVKSGVHYGYWRDEPKNKDNLLMARNDVSKGCEFEFIAANCFDAFLYYLNKDFSITPFNKGEVQKFKKLIESYANEKEILLGNFNAVNKERQKIIVTKTFHKAGIVVPYEKKSQVGYRPLIESYEFLKKCLDRFTLADNDPEIIRGIMDQLQPVITAAIIAMDESDFGTSLELGLNFFSSGHKELHDIIMKLLIPAYSLLQRPQFIAIMKSHLSGRKKGNDVSAFDFE